MSNLTGLFIGAGASYELGMPLVWELTQELKAWLTGDKLRALNRGWRAQGGGYPDPVIEDLIVVLERQDLHYEAILGYLETQYTRKRDLAQDYHGLYSWLVEMVYHLLHARQVNNDEFLGHNLPLFDGLAKLAKENAPLWVFSLNHDVMIEAIAARLGIPVLTGFGPETITLPRRDHTGRKIGEIQGAVLRETVIEKGSLSFPNPGEPSIHLLKIHGALDVFAFNDGKDLLKLSPNPTSPSEIFTTLRWANEELRHIEPRALGGQLRVTNEIAYTDEAGEIQFLRRTLLAGAFKFDMRRSQVLPIRLLEHFRQNLNFVTTLVCVGYGFGDMHINAALRGWLEATDARRLHVVNPGVRDIPAGLLHLATQVTLDPRKASEWFDAQAGIVRSPLEELNKRLAVVMRRLGPAGAQTAVNTFIEIMMEEQTEKLISTLEALPKIDGRPDLAALGDASQVAARWATEQEIRQEDLLRRLLAHVEEQAGRP